MPLADNAFIRVEEVAQELGVSVRKASRRAPVLHPANGSARHTQNGGADHKSTHRGDALWAFLDCSAASFPKELFASFRLKRIRRCGNEACVCIREDGVALLNIGSHCTGHILRHCDKAFYTPLAIRDANCSRFKIHVFYAMH